MFVFKAAILAELNSQLVVDEVSWNESLAPGQVLVKIHRSGICGSQLNEIAGTKGSDPYLPHLLGHEGLGKVVAVGDLVEHVGPNDTVVLHWMPGCGFDASLPQLEWRGRRVNCGRVTTFSEYSIVSGNRCTPVVSDLPVDVLPLFGCALTTAFGVVTREARLEIGENIVILGAGGVGLASVTAARLAGAREIIAVDKVPSRLAAATNAGATHTILSSSDSLDIEQQVLEHLGGAPPEVVLENTGANQIIELGINLVRKGGRCVLVGVPDERSQTRIKTLPLHFGSRIFGSKGGQSDPPVDIPRYVALAESGRLDLSVIPVTTVPLSEINEIIEEIRLGLVGRVVISFD